MSERPELLTVAEVASRLRVHPQTIYRWAKADDDGKVVLPSVVIGGVVRFRQDEVDALVRRQAEAAAS